MSTIRTHEWSISFTKPSGIIVDGLVRLYNDHAEQPLTRVASLFDEVKLK